MTVSEYVSWTALTPFQDKWQFLLLPFNYFCFSYDLAALGLLYYGLALKDGWGTLAQ